MHEMGIALEILNVARAAIPADMAGQSVERLNVRVGRLTGVIPESLRFCFQVARQETPFARATLNIEEVPVEAVCRDCGARTRIETAQFLCRACGSGQIQVVTGTELMVMSVELADGNG